MTCNLKKFRLFPSRKVVAINISDDVSSHEYQYMQLHIVANNKSLNILFCAQMRMTRTWLAPLHNYLRRQCGRK